MTKKITQKEIIMEFFKQNPNREIAHPEVVDWVTREFLARTGNVFRDPDRGIRNLHQQGKLIKISKGVYKYDPSYIAKPNLEDFTNEQKKAIYKRDNYKCVICGFGRADGLEIHADHMVPKDLGGKAEISNGQTLCAKHNFRKKNYSQTESGKKMFIRLYNAAKKISDLETMKFCKDILDTFDEHGINGHIEWKK
jgi:hypothetical protein